jgi:hypothetical protein
MRYLVRCRLKIAVDTFDALCFVFRCPSLRPALLGATDCFLGSLFKATAGFNSSGEKTVSGDLDGISLFAFAPAQIQRTTIQAFLFGYSYDGIATVYPVINGVQYEIANFTTEPFESPEEFLKYREVKEKVPCLRTEKNWTAFFNKLSYHGTSAKPQNYEFSKLMSVIMGYRNHLISIPYLDNPNLSVAEKCAWINRFNTSGKPFSYEDWKRARKPERVSSMLPQELLQDLINRMQAVSCAFEGHILDNHGELKIPEGFFRWVDALTESLAAALICKAA